MTEGNRPSFDLGKLETLFAIDDFADSLLSDDERKILEEWNAACDTIQHEIEEVYGDEDSWPNYMVDWVTDEACRRVLGSSEVVDKLIAMQDNFNQSSTKPL